MDEQSPSIKVTIRGEEIARTIVHGGLGVNVIDKTTCDKLGITKWDACPFSFRMADTSTVRPLGLIRQLDVILGGHTFQIYVVVLHMEAPRAYPLLHGRPSLKIQNRIVLTFRKGKTKIRISTQEKFSTAHRCLPIHAK